MTVFMLVQTPEIVSDILHTGIPLMNFTGGRGLKKCKIWSN